MCVFIQQYCQGHSHVMPCDANVANGWSKEILVNVCKFEYESLTTQHKIIIILESLIFSKTRRFLRTLLAGRIYSWLLTFVCLYKQCSNATRQRMNSKQLITKIYWLNDFTVCKFEILQYYKFQVSFSFSFGLCKAELWHWKLKTIGSAIMCQS